MTLVEMTPDERADAYLDGLLAREEALTFERDLAEKPEVAGALGSALMLREILKALPPARPPAGLEDRIAASLPLRRPAASPAAEARPSNVRAAIAGAIWGVRGPAAVFGGSGSVTAGLSQVRWALGPLAAGRSQPRRKTARRPLWQRALGLGRNAE